MNSGKSTHLLQVNHNYNNSNMVSIVLSPSIDDRFGKGKVTSRMGISTDSIIFERNKDLCVLLKHQMEANPTLNCILIDEAQFMSSDQVKQIASFVDQMDIPVMCYGLRTNYMGEPFDGSKMLLALADTLTEVKTICWCGKKATMNLRTDESGTPVYEGDEIVLGAEDKYTAVCRKHWREGKSMLSSG